MDLISAAEHLQAAGQSFVKYDPDRCLHGIDKFSTCEACFDLCPVGAIQLGNPPTLDEAACAGCMACLPACPLEAFSGDDSVSSLLQCAARLEGQVVEIACGHRASLSSSIEGSAVALQVKSCLAGLGAGAYLGMTVLGIPKLIVRLDACSSCPWEKLFSAALQQVQEAAGLIAAWNCEVTFHAVIPGDRQTWSETSKLLIEASELIPGERPVWWVNNPPVSRRDLFQMVLMQGRAALAQELDQKSDIPWGQPGRERRRILTALRHLPFPAETSPDVRVVPNFVNLKVSEACTACGACARICPTGAVAFEVGTVSMGPPAGPGKNTEIFQLRFKAGSCIDCAACLHACEPEAILIDSPATRNQIIQNQSAILAEGLLTRCENCNVCMASRLGEKLCTLCEMRQENPFAYKAPSWLKKAEE